MSRFFDDIRQIGYVTPDLQKAMTFFIEKAGIGPWFVAERVPVETCTYRGQPLKLEMSIALANSGDVQIELIQQTNSEPSMYSEWLRRNPEGDVPHHYSSWSDRYDEVFATAISLGYEAVQEGCSGFGPFAYFQHPDNPSFVYEVTDFTAPRRRMFEQIAAAAVKWDGSDPVRFGWPA
ncbi:VOC family protein [Phaeovulum sp. NW3]|uniref:VOC family protein n=1 Tax=Phaeovulum sp. NW3 TaxID=2934933 RepID=UPI002021BE9D|nr:VOC family protein [Phaeovulum sp. NW3]